MYLNWIGTDELNNYVDKTHEFQKDAMLEKVVLMSSAFYCMAMEIKFLIAEADDAFSC